MLPASLWVSRLPGYPHCSSVPEKKNVPDKDTSFTADWTANLAHRSDPNRVSPAARGSAGQPALPANRPITNRPVPTGKARQHDPESIPAEPSYYDISILKSPLWKWEIAIYFYLGGLSTGAYILGRLAARHGGKTHKDISRVASYLALASILPAPPLLIHDLGDPKRFHHMLRVWKPSSPMNFGTWAITAYSGMATFDVVRQFIEDRSIRLGTSEHNKLVKLMKNGKLLLVHDALGIPFALLVASYTGVLLSCTSNPMWCKNPWLSPLFTASAVSTGAEAIGLTLECLSSADSPSKKVLRHIDTAAHIAELGMMAGYSRLAGENAATLHTGKMRNYHRFTNGGIIGAEMLKLLPLPSPLRRLARIVAALLGLSAGFAMRWSFIFGGHEAANDPHTARLSSNGSKSIEKSSRSTSQISQNTAQPRRV
jgi:formate-dependent nitrite reductase membrane component NrfD